jgi:hypothetical protein
MATALEETLMSTWQIAGQYFETCNCEFLCPCISSNLAARPTEGDCKVALLFRIERGEKDGVDLSGRSFVALMHSPGPMGDGNMKVGLIVDDGADDAQVEAITAIASGAAGGPMAALAPLVSELAGVERRPIEIQQEGLRYAVRAGELIDEACEGVPSPVREGEPVYLDNTLHPANPRLALAKATRSHFHAFGIDWEDASGTRNGHFAPFSWSG